MRIIKRDGTRKSFDQTKIEGAVARAFVAHDPAAMMGNGRTIPAEVAQEVVELLGREYGNAVAVTVEQVQDAVEVALMKAYPEVAKAYILYRERRAASRLTGEKPDSKAVAEYVHVAKYAGYLPDQRRRETYEETVNRSLAMHLRKYEGHDERIAVMARMAFEDVAARRVLPSMRSMQFGGKAVERNNLRIYNCSFTLINRKRVFGEILVTLLCGCGVGYSVQMQHVAGLPELAFLDRSRVRHHQIADSIEGWGDAVNELMRCAYETGETVEFDYSLIRPQGSPLSTGGKAPGHLPLKEVLEACRAIMLLAQGRRLRPIECHDVVCHLATAVLAGGIRRSSLISLFSPDDTEMLYAKAHGHFVPAGMKDARGHPLHPRNEQRAMANNSAVFHRAEVKREQFARVVAVSREWGDPGFYFTWNTDFGCNPCGEIGMYPVLGGQWDGVDRTLDFKPYVPRDPVLSAINADLAAGGKQYAKMLNAMYGLNAKFGISVRAKNEERFLEVAANSDKEAIAAYGHRTGFQFCNLCEVNVAACATDEEFLNAVESAAVIGTLQAGYDRFPYLGPVTERVVRQEALLGVGLTGIMDRPGIGLNRKLLTKAAEAAIETNVEVAAMIDINPAARVTTVKPSGTASLELGCVGSGIHPHHSCRYFRRITANPNEAPAVHFRAANPHAVEVKPDGDLSLVFAVEPPAGSVTLDDMSGLDFMDDVFNVYESWVVPGTVSDEMLPESEHLKHDSTHNVLTHNVSCTVHVRKGEWDAVIEKAWDNRHRIAAMSFFPVFNDHLFPFAPRMAVTTPADETRWHELIREYRPVDWAALGEANDGVSRTSEPACAGGSCEAP